MIYVDEGILISAVRYALGRSTYVVGQTVDTVMDVWEHLSDNAKSVILRDITYTPDLGMDMDREEWMRLHNRGVNEFLSRD